jgi:hypothetical protein
MTKIRARSSGSERRSEQQAHGKTDEAARKGWRRRGERASARGRRGARVSGADSPIASATFSITARSDDYQPNYTT